MIRGFISIGMGIILVIYSIISLEYYYIGFSIMFFILGLCSMINNGNEFKRKRLKKKFMKFLYPIHEKMELKIIFSLMPIENIEELFELYLQDVRLEFIKRLKE